jgi:predicted CoA-binding protein
VPQLLLAQEELGRAASAAAAEATKETEIISVFRSEGAAMPTADETYLSGLTLVTGAADLELDFVT